MKTFSNIPKVFIVTSADNKVSGFCFCKSDVNIRHMSVNVVP